MAKLTKIAPCLWFDRDAEAAAELYTSIFPGSRILHVTRYGNVGQEVHGMEPGTVMTVTFELFGISFTAMNGGPAFRFSEAVSFQVMCDTQEEIDHYWDRLSEGGDPQAQQCGWLKDRFGLSWQVSSEAMYDMLTGPDPARADRAMAALLPMKKIDLGELRRAYDG